MMFDWNKEVPDGLVFDREEGYELVCLEPDGSEVRLRKSEVLAGESATTR